MLTRASRAQLETLPPQILNDLSHPQQQAFIQKMVTYTQIIHEDGASRLVNSLICYLNQHGDALGYIPLLEASTVLLQQVAAEHYGDLGARTLERFASSQRQRFEEARASARDLDFARIRETAALGWLRPAAGQITEDTAVPEGKHIIVQMDGDRVSLEAAQALYRKYPAGRAVYLQADATNGAMIDVHSGNALAGQYAVTAHDKMVIVAHGATDGEAPTHTLAGVTISDLMKRLFAETRGLFTGTAPKKLSLLGCRLGGPVAKQAAQALAMRFPAARIEVSAREGWVLVDQDGHRHTVILEQSGRIVLLQGNEIRKAVVTIEAGADSRGQRPAQTTHVSGPKDSDMDAIQGVTAAQLLAKAKKSPTTSSSSFVEFDELDGPTKMNVTVNLARIFAVMSARPVVDGVPQDSHLAQRGLYRVPGSALRIKELRNKMYTQLLAAQDIQAYDANTLASVIKAHLGAITPFKGGIPAALNGIAPPATTGTETEKAADQERYNAEVYRVFQQEMAKYRQQTPENIRQLESILAKFHEVSVQQRAAHPGETPDATNQMMDEYSLGRSIGNTLFPMHEDATADFGRTVSHANAANLFATALIMGYPSTPFQDAILSVNTENPDVTHYRLINTQVLSDGSGWQKLYENGAGQRKVTVIPVHAVIPTSRSGSSAVAVNTEAQLLSVREADEIAAIISKEMASDSVLKQGGWQPELTTTARLADGRIQVTFHHTTTGQTETRMFTGEEAARLETIPRVMQKSGLQHAHRSVRLLGAIIGNAMNFKSVADGILAKIEPGLPLNQQQLLQLQQVQTVHQFIDFGDDVLEGLRSRLFQQVVSKPLASLVSKLPTQAGQQTAHLIASRIPKIPGINTFSRVSTGAALYMDGVNVGFNIRDLVGAKTDWEKAYAGVALGFSSTRMALTAVGMRFGPVGAVVAGVTNLVLMPIEAMVTGVMKRYQEAAAIKKVMTDHFSAIRSAYQQNGHTISGTTLTLLPQAIVKKIDLRQGKINFNSQYLYKTRRGEIGTHAGATSDWAIFGPVGSDRADKISLREKWNLPGHADFDATRVQTPVLSVMPGYDMDYEYGETSFSSDHYEGTLFDELEQGGTFTAGEKKRYFKLKEKNNTVYADTNIEVALASRDCYLHFPNFPHEYRGKLTFQFQGQGGRYTLKLQTGVSITLASDAVGTRWFLDATDLAVTTVSVTAQALKFAGLTLNIAGAKVGNSWDTLVFMDKDKATFLVDIPNQTYYLQNLDAQGKESAWADSYLAAQGRAGHIQANSVIVIDHYQTAHGVRQAFYHAATHTLFYTASKQIADAYPQAKFVGAQKNIGYFAHDGKIWQVNEQGHLLRTYNLQLLAGASASDIVYGMQQGVALIQVQQTFAAQNQVPQYSVIFTYQAGANTLLLTGIEVEGPAGAPGALQILQDKLLPAWQKPLPVTVDALSLTAQTQPEVAAILAAGSKTYLVAQTDNSYRHVSTWADAPDDLRLVSFDAQYQYFYSKKNKVLYKQGKQETTHTVLLENVSAWNDAQQQATTEAGQSYRLHAGRGFLTGLNEKWLADRQAQWPLDKPMQGEEQDEAVLTWLGFSQDTQGKAAYWDLVFQQDALRLSGLKDSSGHALEA